MKRKKHNRFAVRMQKYNEYLLTKATLMGAEFEEYHSFVDSCGMKVLDPRGWAYTFSDGVLYWFVDGYPTQFAAVRAFLRRYSKEHPHEEREAYPRGN